MVSLQHAAHKQIFNINTYFNAYYFCFTCAHVYVCIQDGSETKLRSKGAVQGINIIENSENVHYR